MNFLEFLEALSRAVDYCEMLPHVKVEYRHWYVVEMDVKDWLLDMKLEYIVPNMLLLLKVDRRRTVQQTIKINNTAYAHDQQVIDISKYNNT
jgi:hypothetical protein